MTANEFRMAVGLIPRMGIIKSTDSDKLRVKIMIINRILDLEESLALDNEKSRKVFRIQQWENLKSRLYYSRLNLELNKQILSSLM